MQAFRDRRLQVVGLAGISLTAAYLLSDQIDAIAFSRTGKALADQVAAMRAQLPSDQPDGSRLEEVAFDGRRITLHLLADSRIDMRVMRDGGRDEKCGEWRRALRSREIDEVEYRYRQEGAVSSVFLDRSVCG